MFNKFFTTKTWLLLCVLVQFGNAQASLVAHQCGYPDNGLTYEQYGPYLDGAKRTALTYCQSQCDYRAKAKCGSGYIELPPDGYHCRISVLRKNIDRGGNDNYEIGTTGVFYCRQ